MYIYIYVYIARCIAMASKQPSPTSPRTGCRDVQVRAAQTGVEKARPFSDELLSMIKGLVKKLKGHLAG